MLTERDIVGRATPRQHALSIGGFMALRITQTLLLLVVMLLLVFQQHEIYSQGMEIIKNKQDFLELSQNVAQFMKETNRSLGYIGESIENLTTTAKYHSESIKLIIGRIQ